MRGGVFGTLRRRRRKWAHAPIAPSRLAGGGRGGGAFLPELFGGEARQWIEMAFGADLSADPDTWSWTDVTSCFLWDAGINTALGRPPESTRIVPASITGMLRNDQPNGGDWTVGNALSPRWPNVRENTPVRARLDIGNGPTVRFQGYAVSFKPDVIGIKDSGDRIAVIRFKAAGAARPLVQSKSAPQSPMWRSVMLAYRYPTTTNTVDGSGYVTPGDGGYAARPARYWPLEDGYGALGGTDALDARYSLRPGSFYTLPDFASGVIGVGSKPLTTFKTAASLAATFPLVALGASQRPDLYTTTGLRVQFLMKLPQATFDELNNGGAGPDVEILRLTFAGTIARISLWLDFDPGGMSIYMRAYDVNGSTIATTPLFNDNALIDADVMLTMIFRQDGANTLNRFLYNPLGTTPGTGVPFGEGEYVAYDLDMAGRTLVGVTGVTIAPGANLAGLVLGHLGIFNGGEGTWPDITNRAPRGRAGDTVELRQRRLSIEDGVRLDIVGTADAKMGVQGIGGYLDLMMETEAVDAGLLVDGLGPGLTYIARTTAYSRPADLALDVAAGQVLQPLRIDHDDLGRVNVFTASNPTGGEATFAKETGDLSVAEIGTAPSTGLFPVALDTMLADLAAWQVNLGTVPGLRYPSVPFELAKPGTTPLAQRWLDTRPFSRIDILGLEPASVDPNRRFLLTSWTEKWNSRQWSVTTALRPYSPYMVPVLAADVGDVSDFLFRPSAGFSTLVADVAPGDGSFQVATSYGPVWTTNADDIQGLVIEIAGLRIPVTNITGTASPQTFTVDGTAVRKGLSANTAVDIWQAPGLGL